MGCGPRRAVAVGLRPQLAAGARRIPVPYLARRSAPPRASLWAYPPVAVGLLARGCGPTRPWLRPCGRPAVWISEAGRRRVGENGRVPRARILVIDNYDSFVYNLVQYLAQIGAAVEVWRNDDPRFADPAFSADFDGILISPGPGTPEHAGACVDVVKTQAGRLPIFGVCLGLQSIGVAYGAVVDRAPELLHGKTSLIHHEGAGVLAGLPSPFTATRYHSLAIEPDSMPPVLEITASTVSGVIMAVRHRDLPIEAVQFHPESVLTEGGYQMLANWLAICGDSEAPGRAVGMAPLMSAR